MSRFQMTLGVIGLIFVGMLVIVGLGVREVWIGYQSQRWPQGLGTVTESTVVSRDSHSDRKEVHGAVNRTVSQQVTLFLPIVKYTYEVDGQSFSSERVTISDGILFDNMTAATAQAAKYPVGTRVTVFYNPRNAALAVLEVGISEGARTTLVLGLAFSAVFGGLLAFAVSKTGREVISAFSRSAPEDPSTSRPKSKRISPKHRDTPPPP